MRHAKYTESVIIVTEVLGATDDFGNPTVLESQREIKNALIEHGSGSISYQLHQNFTSVEIIVYLDASEEISTTDKIIYNGKKYLQSAPPVRWGTFGRSRLKPKVILSLKAVS